MNEYSNAINRFIVIVRKQILLAEGILHYNVTCWQNVSAWH